MIESKHKLIPEVVFIRPLLIILLVFYHAFAPFSGGWAPIDGFSEVKLYWWLDKLSYACMLEMFVFVSGFVFGYQVKTKGEEKLNAKTLFISKFKRLLIPSIVFSLLYIVLLEDIPQPVMRTVYDVINGAGHMWFLPMLFWCFVGVWVIERLSLNHRLALLLLMILSTFSFLPLPLQLGHTMYYCFFFYYGYILQRKKIPFESKLYAKKTVVVLVVAFALLFPTLTLITKEVNGFLVEQGNRMIIKVLCLSFNNFIRLVYSIVGIMMLMSIVGRLFYKRPSLEIPHLIIEISGLCMGVYLLQQFILKYWYYHTNLPDILGVYWTPWGGFISTLFLSLVISYLLKKTRIGRFLIG